MFTGIIQEVGEISGIEQEAEWTYYTISSNQIIKDVKIGSSIAVDGICLTVLKFNDQSFVVQVMPETIDKTNLTWKLIGSKVNLESALKVGDRLDGHFVMGHVDEVGVVADVTTQKDKWILKISPGRGLMKYIAYKGSIALNGTSLTVSLTGNNFFEVSLIKHTLENTDLGELKSGDIVNIEIDMFARYIENLNKKSN